MDLELYIYIDQNYEFKNSSAIKYYYLNLNAEAVQSAFNRNFKNAEYVLEKKVRIINFIEFLVIRMIIN